MGEEKLSSLRLLLVVQLSQNFRSGVISPILSLFIRRQGRTITQIGLLGTAGMLGWLFFEPLSGVVADRVRKKYMIVFAIISSTIVYAAYPFAGGIWQFALLAFSMSSVLSAFAISVKAMTAELLPVKERGKTYGRYLSVISMGGMIAPFLGGFLAATVGYTIPFCVSVGIGIVGLTAVLMMKHDPRPVVEEPKVEDTSGTNRLMTGPFIGILAVRMLFMFNLLFHEHFLPIYLNESPNFRASEADIGAYMDVARITSALSQAFLGSLIDRVGSRRVVASSVGLIGFSYLGMAYLGGMPFVYALGAFQGVFQEAADMGMMMHLMGIMPEGRTGMVMGIYFESENIGGMAASPLLGIVYDGFGPVSSVLSVAAILVFNAALSVFLVKERRSSKIG